MKTREEFLDEIEEIRSNKFNKIALGIIDAIKYNLKEHLANDELMSEGDRTILVNNLSELERIEMNDILKYVKGIKFEYISPKQSIDNPVFQEEPGNYLIQNGRITCLNKYEIQ